jgi:hypothetical protein
MAVKGKRKQSKKKVTTQEMEVAIANYFGYRTHIIVPNVSWGFFNHECDLFLIRKSGYGFEVEIKRSRSDMLADFKKKHNHSDRANRIVQLYYAFPEELLPKVEELVPPECGIITVEKNEWNRMPRAHMVRDAKRRKGARPLTQKEQLQIARLGTLRIWTLKQKIISLLYGRNKI